MAETVETLRFDSDVADVASEDAAAVDKLALGLRTATTAVDKLAQAGKTASSALKTALDGTDQSADKTAKGVKRVVSELDRARKSAEEYGRVAAARSDELFRGFNKTPTDLLPKGALPQLGLLAKTVKLVGQLFGRDTAASLVSGAGKVTDVVERFGGATGKISAGLTALGAAAGAAVAVVAAAVAALAVGAVKLTASLVELSISAAEFKKSTTAGLEALLGSKAAAEATFKELKKFADLEAPFESVDVAKSFKKLLGAGFDTARTKSILRGLFDIAAFNDMDKQVAEALTDVIAEIKDGGKLTNDAVNQLVEQSGGAINRSKFMAELATVAGKSIDALERELAKGKIDADTATKAILETIRKNVSGGELGKLSKQLAGESVPGLLSTISSQAKGLFEDVDISPLTEGLKSVTEVLSGTGGEDLKRAVTELGTETFKTLFGPFQGPEGKKKLEGFIQTLTNLARMGADLMRDLRPYVKDAIDLIEALFSGKELAGGESSTVRGIRGLRDILAGILGLDVSRLKQGLAELFHFDADAVTSGLQLALTDGMSAVMGAVVQGALSIGGSIIEGIVAGIAGAGGRVIDAVTSLVKSALGAGMVAQQAHSPSKAWENVARYGALGFALGFDRNTPAAEKSAINMVDQVVRGGAGAVNDNAARAPQRSGARAGGALPELHVHIHLPESAVASPAGAQAAAETVRSVVISPEFRRQFSALMRELKEAG